MFHMSLVIQENRTSIAKASKLVSNDIRFDVQCRANPSKPCVSIVGRIVVTPTVIPKTIHMIDAIHGKIGLHSMRSLTNVWHV